MEITVRLDVLGAVIVVTLVGLGIYCYREKKFTDYLFGLAAAGAIIVLVDSFLMKR